MIKPLVIIDVSATFHMIDRKMAVKRLIVKQLHIFCHDMHGLFLRIAVPSLIYCYNSVNY